MTAATWSCPRCGRRVPNRAPACHCGTTQEEARRKQAQLPPSPAPLPRRLRGPGLREIWNDLTWDLRALAIAVAVVVLAGVGWLFVPRKPEPIAPVLGIVAPAPSPSPSPMPRAKRWWWPFK